MLYAGSIPAAFGTSGSWDQLSMLQLAGNQLNGTIPQMWVTRSSVQPSALVNDQPKAEATTHTKAVGIRCMMQPCIALTGAQQSSSATTGKVVMHRKQHLRHYATLILSVLPCAGCRTAVAETCFQQ